MAEGGAFYVLHDPSMIMSRCKRGRGREIVAEIIAGGTPVSEWRVVVRATRSPDSTSSGLTNSSHVAQTRGRNSFFGGIVNRAGYQNPIGLLWERLLRYRVNNPMFQHD